MLATCAKCSLDLSRISFVQKGKPVQIANVMAPKVLEILGLLDDLRRDFQRRG